MNQMQNPEPVKKLVAVDDDLAILRVIVKIFAGHNIEVVTFAAAPPALDYLLKNGADLLLSDVQMPEMSGVELLARVREKDRELPVIIMTGYTELESAVGAIRQGASDFILKPFEVDYLVHAVKKALDYRALQEAEKRDHLLLESKVRERTASLAAALADLHQANREVTARLLRLAEYRDVETGAHIRRLGFYANKLAGALGQDQAFVDAITLAAPMHDIGKVGIPDEILLKQGPLLAEEWRIMQGHTLIGSEVLADSALPFLKMAATVALTHHERWDGSGYPHGLSGERIPLAGRIVILCDQYDALRSARPYKGELSHQEVVRIIIEGDGRTEPGHFAPEVLAAFQAINPIFKEIYRQGEQ